MSSIFDLIQSQLGRTEISELSRSIGADESTTQSAIGAALPALLGALNRNTDRPGGAGALQSALTRDHDGSILDDVAGHFAGRSSGKSADGAGILGHLFGGKQDMIAAGLAKTTGTDSGAMTSMLGKLAPVVMGALGKQQRQGGLDASALSSLLTGERREMEKRDSNAGGLMAKLFDQDGDGDLDLGDLASGIGRLF